MNTRSRQAIAMINKDDLVERIKVYEQKVTRQAKETFITDATNNYPDVSSKPYDYWANGK